MCYYLLGGREITTKYQHGTKITAKSSGRAFRIWYVTKKSIILRPDALSPSYGYQDIKMSLEDFEAGYNLC